MKRALPALVVALALPICIATSPAITPALQGSTDPMPVEFAEDGTLQQDFEVLATGTEPPEDRTYTSRLTVSIALEAIADGADTADTASTALPLEGDLEVWIIRPGEEPSAPTAELPLANTSVQGTASLDHILPANCGVECAADYTVRLELERPLPDGVRLAGTWTHTVSVSAADTDPSGLQEITILPAD